MPEFTMQPFQDGYRAGLDLGDEDECPIPETDDPNYAEWRNGWLAGREERRRQIGS